MHSENIKENIIEELRKYYYSTNNWINFFSGRNSLVNKFKSKEGPKILENNKYVIIEEYKEMYYGV